MNRSDIIIRDGRQLDVNFIASTWLKGLLYGGDELFRKMPKEVFFDNQHKVIEKILSSPVTRVKVACLKGDADVILGYTVYREAGNQTVLDWCFVKKDWRGIGIAKSLVPDNVNAVTNLTRAAEAILVKYPKVIYNPYL